MAIHIIGAKPDPEPEESPLAPVDVDLPHPASATAANRVLDDAAVEKLLDHENPIVRTYALEQVATRKSDDLAAAAAKLVEDADPLVAVEAIGLAEQLKQKAAVEPLKTRFADATGDLAAAIASALGQLAPEVLLDQVKQRGRLDGEAYAATATALAIIGSDEVIDFLDKALNRAGALTADRKGALYGAALLSGNEALAGRVLSLAIEDSKKDDPPGASFPSRAALSVLTGVPLPYSRREAGLELLDVARDTLEVDVVPLLAEEQRAALEAALKTKQPHGILSALAPVLELEVPEQQSVEDAELGSMPRRRRGLLTALVARADALEELELAAAALFVAVATKAASIIIAGGGDEAKSPGIAALSKALEGSHDEATLASMSPEDTKKLFEEKSPRDMRRVLSILTRETFLRGATIERFFTAAIAAGHGEGLIDAGAESDDPAVHAAVIRAFGSGSEAAEEAVVTVLERTPLDERATAPALACAEEVRTEKIGLLVARRFLELRKVNRSATSRVLLRVGDPRLLPVLEARAFADEPEEVAWAVLALVCGQPVEGKLQEALERTMKGRDGGPERPEVRLPLQCKRCEEVLWYGFPRVYIDVDAKDELGDPAFVGKVVCKACQTPDQLEPTEEGVRVLTDHMMRFLQAAQTGRLDVPPLVTPAQTNVGGKRVGLAEALRLLEKDIAVSPEAIRPRLHRARLRLLLERDGASEDLDAALAADANCVEAMAMRASVEMRAGNHAAAVEQAVAAVRRLRGEEDVRLYDTDSKDTLTESLEEYLVELADLDQELPEDLDLTAARRRRDEKIRDAQAALAARREPGPPPGAPPPPGAEEAPEPPAPVSFKNVGRNDPCPCGSGKKFKKCHGAR